MPTELRALRFCAPLVLLLGAVGVDAAPAERLVRDLGASYSVVRVENRGGSTSVRVRSDAPARLIATLAAPIEAASLAALVRVEEGPGGVLTVAARPGPVIDLELELPAGTHLSVRGGEKPVTVAGRVSGVSIETVSGPIALFLSDDASIDLAARSERGMVRSELPVTLFGSSDPHRLEGTLGRGGFPVIARSVEGSIRIARLRTETLASAAPEREVREPAVPGPAATGPDPGSAASIRVDVRLVNLNVKVTDRVGRGVTGLQREDFEVREDGVVQNVTHFAPTHTPVSLVVLLDLSGSMREKIDVIRKAAERFLDALAPEDQVAAAAFTRRFLPISSFTRDRRLLRKRIGDLRNLGSGTGYYDAMWSALDLLGEAEGTRKAIVVMTDGVDSSLAHPDVFPTRHTFDELATRAAEEDATIYPIYLDTEYDVVVRRRQDSHEAYVEALRQLRGLADQTGGTLFRADRFEDLEGVYQKVAAELRMLYSLAYAPSNSARDGSWRAVDVRAHRPGAVARTRKGYFAK